MLGMGKAHGQPVTDHLPALHGMASLEACSCVVLVLDQSPSCHCLQPSTDKRARCMPYAKALRNLVVLKNRYLLLVVRLTICNAKPGTGCTTVDHGTLRPHTPAPTPTGSHLFGAWGPCLLPGHIPHFGDMVSTSKSAIICPRFAFHDISVD